MARVHQEHAYMLERARLSRENEVLRQRALQQRHRLEQESIKIRTGILDGMNKAREQTYLVNQAVRQVCHATSNQPRPAQIRPAPAP